MLDAKRVRLLEPEFLRKLERLALIAKRVHLGLAKGERRSRRKGSSVEFADYRDYVQGDDPRHVDWNLAGRLNTLYLKLFQEQEDLTLHLLIDASASMRFGAPPKLGFACKMAAAVGYIALVGYDRLSVEAFCGEAATRLPRCRGKASTYKFFTFLESILDARPDEKKDTRLEEWCRSYALRNRAKGVAVLLSDFLDPSGFDGCLRRLSTSGSDLYVVHVLSRDEVEPQVTGDLRLIDSETNAFTEISMSRALLKRYKDNVGGFCTALRRECLARGIGYIPATSDMPFERLVLDLIRRGGMVK
jgi:uncharacterized protein (DUF58 family)